MSLLNHCLWLIAFVLFAQLLSSCDKNKKNDNPPLGNGRQVIVVNEGNFMWGNASLSVYDPDAKSLSDDVFKQVNGRALGDLFQSAYVMKDKDLAFFCIDNSNKMEVVSLPDFRSVATVTGLTSPRYFLPVSANKAYVSSIHADKLSIVNLNDYSISGYINCPGWTEKMLLSGTQVYVCNAKTEYVYIIDSGSDRIIDSIHTGYGPSSVLADGGGHIWVSTMGDDARGIKAALLSIDAGSHAVIHRWEFSSGSAKALCKDRNSAIYWLNNGVFKMNISDAALPASAFIPAGGHLFYGLNTDIDHDEIYVSDAIDYVQKGKVYRYSANALLIDSFRVGIIPGDFAFR